MKIIYPEILLPEFDQFGFCKGVQASDDLLRNVSAAANQFGFGVYGYHDIVHNRQVIDRHLNNGVIFVNDHDSIPERSIVVPSAHGTSPRVLEDLKCKKTERCLTFISRLFSFSSIFV
jgi:4-hydroxy-3-methylbut-2-en-1-yl diphosphate reductase